MPCEFCTHASEYGWWGPGLKGSHCAGCHRSWMSSSQSHCVECHRHFGSDSAGDAHRVTGECVDPKGFDVWRYPSGVVWGGPDPESMARLTSFKGSVRTPGDVFSGVVDVDTPEGVSE